MTLYAYVDSVRIDRARALLAEGELTLKEIARASGFSTACYFSTAFRRATGETPAGYRTRVQAEA